MRPHSTPRSASKILAFSALAAPAVPSIRDIPDYVRQPHVLSFRADAAEQQLLGVDLSSGRINGVSILSAGREAAGHGLWVDDRTCETGRVAMLDRLVKAYAKHERWRDRTLSEVGAWSSPRIDGQQLRADFEALKAWRKHHEAEFDTLFEMATKMPGEFGASLTFRFTLAWVRKDGTELPTDRKFRVRGMWDYEEYFEPAKPADAVRDLPSVRIEEVFSADFVDTPAANDGLFRSAAVDGAANNNNPPQSNSSAFAMIKELYAKFSGDAAKLARAIALHTENEKLTFSEIVNKVEIESMSSELARLRGVETQFSAIAASLEKAGFKAEGDKTAFDALLSSQASLKSAAAGHEQDQLALKAAGFEAKDGKTAVELALAAHKKASADLAVFRNGGCPPVDTGAKGGEGSASKTKTRAEFDALTPAEKMEFSANGGRITG